MTASRLGLAAALATLALDQATKLYVLFGLDLPLREPLRLAPFLDLIVVWNRGISYGLFQQDSEIGRWGLVAISLAAALGLSLWIRRATGRILALSLGLIVGGALGNVIDRIREGAVIDFIKAVDFWPAFNVADISVTLGVIALLWVMERGDARHRRA
jgi:signal peptidase II